MTRLTAPAKGEPILWCGSAVRTIVEHNGAVSRAPQSGHVGDYDDPKPLGGRRWIQVVNHVGNTVRVVLSSGAGLNAESDPNFATRAFAKARHFGWMRVGECPIRLVARGELRPSTLRSTALLAIVQHITDAMRAAPDDDERQVVLAREVARLACKPATNGDACDHARAEREARLSAQRQSSLAVEEASRGEALAQQRTLANAAAAGVAEVLAPVLAQLAALSRPPEPEPPEPKGRRKPG